MDFLTYTLNVHVYVFEYDSLVVFVHADGKCCATAMVEVMHEDLVSMALDFDGPNQLANYNDNYLYRAIFAANFEIWTKYHLAMFLAK